MLNVMPKSSRHGRECHQQILNNDKHNKHVNRNVRSHGNNAVYARYGYHYNYICIIQTMSLSTDALTFLLGY